MTKTDNDEPEIVYLDEKEVLEGLLIITQGRLGAAHSLLDRLYDATRETLQPRLKEIQNNLPRELRNAKGRATHKFEKDMVNSVGVKPDNMDLHHVVAWGDKRAQEALAILLQFGIDPHSAINGVYIPRHMRHTPHPAMPKALAHSRTHTKIYRANVLYVLREATKIPGAMKADIEKALREIALSLQDGTFPIHELIAGT